MSRSSQNLHDPRPPLDRWFERVFGDPDPGHLGSGWASGTASVFLGALGLLAVLVLWFPAALSTPLLRSAYPLPVMRGLIAAVIAAAFLAGCLSLLLRRRKVLGLAGCGLALAAALLGGGGVSLPERVESSVAIGLDWFLLDIFLLAVVFVPLERAFPRLPEQGPFRIGWTTDSLHFLVSHLLVQAVSFLTLMPAAALASLWTPAALQSAVGGQPQWLQLMEIVLLADLTQYAVHRSFHRVPLLWRFHAIHHSSQALDWLAGSRLHLVDVVVTRGLVLVPLHLAGFAQTPLYAYLVIVSFHAVLIHANLRFRFGPLEALLVTPRFHHWHHAAAPAARDTNFAVHLPWLDRLFGSFHLPEDEWPAEYGITDRRVPEDYPGQLFQPFRPDTA